MEIKASPLGYLVYATMLGYSLAFLASLVTEAMRFQKYLRPMGRRAVVFGFWQCVVGGLLSSLAAGGFWLRNRAFPSKALLTALLAFVSAFVLFCLVGLGAAVLHVVFQRLLRSDDKRRELLLARLRKVTLICLSVSAGCIGAAYVVRWYAVGHVPLQNLFEVFLTLGLLVIPISMLCRALFGIRALTTDLLLGVCILFPAGFIFHSEPQRLPPALQSWLFAPHVAVYMLSYVFMAKAYWQATFHIWTHGLMDASLRYKDSTYDMVRIGFPLLTLGLILGSVWGKLAWGDYWGWDPKELWSLASWLLYVGYFHWRYMFGKRYPRTNSAWALAGMAAIVITLLWVNLSRLFSGLHSYAT